MWPSSLCRCCRRYSDFEWLHSRLSVTFPAAIIPLCECSPRRWRGTAHADSAGTASSRLYTHTSLLPAPPLALATHAHACSPREAGAGQQRRLVRRGAAGGAGGVPQQGERESGGQSGGHGDGGGVARFVSGRSLRGRHLQRGRPPLACTLLLALLVVRRHHLRPPLPPTCAGRPPPLSCDVAGPPRLPLRIRQRPRGGARLHRGGGG